MRSPVRSFKALAAAAVFTLVAATPLLAQGPVRRRAIVRDRLEDVRDRREDRRDRREVILDRREDRLDRLEDRRDARHFGGRRDVLEDTRDQELMALERLR